MCGPKCFAGHALKSTCICNSLQSNLVTTESLVPGLNSVVTRFRCVATWLQRNNSVVTRVSRLQRNYSVVARFAASRGIPHGCKRVGRSTWPVIYGQFDRGPEKFVPLYPGSFPLYPRGLQWGRTRSRPELRYNQDSVVTRSVVTRLDCMCLHNETRN